MLARLTAGALLTCAVTFSACIELTSPVNAPWHIDVQKPPDDRALEAGVPEVPRDPGIVGGVASLGVLGARGVDTRRPSSAYEGGFELSVQGGTADSGPLGLLLDRALGLNVGWIASSRSGRELNHSDRGLLYAEVQATRRVLWAAGGWGVALADRASGPQATAGLGPLYLRYAYLPESGGSLLLGLVLNGRVAWARTRR